MQVGIVGRLAMLVAASGFIASVHAQGPEPTPVPPDVVLSGEFVIEPATLINLGFEWFVQGDVNRNAAVEVSYRRAGDAAWRPALPLLRLGGERVYAESRVDVVVPDIFAGSVLDLQPDTRYEVQFVQIGRAHV